MSTVQIYFICTRQIVHKTIYSERKGKMEYSNLKEVPSVVNDEVAEVIALLRRSQKLLQFESSTYGLSS